ncbi:MULTISPECIES: type IV toxin-antitoxin system AbiEi family antitoxin domain-containing protein [unclassified Ectothiorhodospira]|uniref:type IV toxin-antitoxin system AbiEi family antitoxin domain-containing protein n=1 Tax=unclassified Ectothiorhodospira TaxID=2684909 RepID=UPI001EE7BDFA|nr:MULTISPECIES: type IV toxin-antitoxin system AbiEi family antitoxin domain-containing protein [unclassified Ectothiorhodospira]MCG5516879.1 type IV toxin-antitoxin system AbiEi family antitoxin domain-containing protein [Ectothiorhodospira sp. 9100]MCG5519841.1 type IV toxin-antitoxin system AbiEi family antitoxin domain-containing protein [Ectothiorhodospira sp. 9905]
MTHTLNHLTAQQIYELAEQKAREEYEQQEATRREQFLALKAERREMLSSHREAQRRLQEAQRAELAHLDGKLLELGARLPKGSPLQGRSTQRPQVEQWLQIIAQAPEMTLADIRELATREGLPTHNLPQRLAQLRRQGHLEQVRRGVYRVAQQDQAVAPPDRQVVGWS